MTVIDGTTNSTNDVSAGSSPAAVAVNPVTNKIYVANSYSNSSSITVIDGATNATSTINTGQDPVAVAVNSVTNKIYVLNYYSGNMTVIDGATNGTSAVDTGVAPFAVAVNPATNKIYVANRGDYPSTVTVVDGFTNSTTTVIVGGDLCCDSGSLVVDSVANKIYVVNSNKTTATVIDGGTNSTSSIDTGNNLPFNVAVDLATNKIYVDGCTAFASPFGLGCPISGSGLGLVTVIDGVTNATTTVSGGQTSFGALAVNPVTNTIYVASSYGSNGVTAIDGVTNSTTTVATGFSPNAIAINSVTNKIYVATCGDDQYCGNSNSPGSVTVINGPLTAIHTLTVTSANPSSGVAISVSPPDNGNQGDGTTQFTRTYNDGVAVTLNAAATAGGNNFSSWTGCDSTSATNCTVTMNADRSVTANYVTPPPPVTHTLTVTSTNPSSGVAVTVAPMDNGSQGNGVTQFTRTYNDGVAVTLTAAATAGGNNFSSWTGCDSTSATNCAVTMNADRTVAANYLPPAGTTCETIVKGAVSPLASGTIMYAAFTPNFELTLSEAAAVCGFSNFDWGQQITNFPYPSIVDLADGTQLTSASTPFNDPPPGGYAYCITKFGTPCNQYPFYYDPDTQDTVFSLVKHESSAAPLCLTPPPNTIVNVANPKTLCFRDAPADPYLPAGTFQAFATKLVGVLPGPAGSPSRLVPLSEMWTWKSTFDGTSGGVLTTLNESSVDPGSGTGGVTIAGINGVPQAPPTVRCTATPNLLWPPNGKAVSVIVSGTVALGTQPLSSGGLSYAVARWPGEKEGRCRQEREERERRLLERYRREARRDVVAERFEVEQSRAQTDQCGQVQPNGQFVLGADGSYSFGVSLIAARNGYDLEGRTYTIVVTATDTIGNTGSCSVVVTVPHDQRSR